MAPWGATEGRDGRWQPSTFNSDVGESFGRWVLGDHESLMPWVTSANVACGSHAGDASTLRGTCQLAVAAGVTVGAHTPEGTPVSSRQAGAVLHDAQTVTRRTIRLVDEA